MGQTDFLRLRVELAGLAPDQCIPGVSNCVRQRNVLEVRCQTSVNTVADGLDRSTLSQADRIR